MRRLALALIAACHHHPVADIATPAAGVSITMYGKNGGGAYGVVDDRRMIDVKGGAIELDDVDPGAALGSLVIESLSGGSLAIDSCVRDRVSSLPSPGAMLHRAVRRRNPSAPVKVEDIVAVDATGAPVPPKPADTDHYAPTVRCVASGATGRHLVRVLYVSSTLAYRAEHDLAMTADDKVTVTTRFAIETPAWAQRDGADVRASVVLYDGVPGGEHAPLEVARGQIVIDGSTAVIAPPAHATAARLRRIYDGAMPSDVNGLAPTDPGWGTQSHDVVWVWLELPKLRLPPGPLHVHVELPSEGTRDIEVPAEARKQGDETDATLALPLWADDDLHGQRQKFPLGSGGARLDERMMASVSNTGESAREVWVEETLRPNARFRKITHAWPGKPSVHGDVLRTKLVVKPGAIERTGYTISYSF